MSYSTVGKWNEQSSQHFQITAMPIQVTWDRWKIPWKRSTK